MTTTIPSTATIGGTVSVSSLMNLGTSVTGALNTAMTSVRNLWSNSRQLASRGIEWTKTHQKEVGIGIAVATAIGGYVVYKKVKPMVIQLRAELQMMDQLAKQLNPENQATHKHAVLLHRLEHNLTVGDLTLRQFVPPIRSDLCARFDVDSVRARLKKGNGSEQAAVWEEFKVIGFSRTIAAVYIIAMLHALIKLQVSIVSRYVLYDQQAQSQRAEAEAAERGGQIPGAATSSAGSTGDVPSATSTFTPNQPFIPPQQCEEINRIYFSMSTHMCKFGSSQLADAISSCIRMELLGQPVTTSLDQTGLSATLIRIRSKIEEEVLGLESKDQNDENESNLHTQTQVEKYNETEIANSTLQQEDQRVIGSSISTIQFPSLPRHSHSFLRFLLPSPESLSSLVTSPSFSDSSLNNMASFRLAEMLAETRSVMMSAAFEHVLRESTRIGMNELEELMKKSAYSNTSQQVPLANVLVSIIKLFNVLVPDVTPGSGGVGLAASNVASPLYHVLADLPAMKELAAVVYLPSEAITSITPTNQLSVIQQITQNQHFAGNEMSRAITNQQRSQTQMTEVVEGPQSSSSSSSSSSSANRSTFVPVQTPTNIYELKGLPISDRL